MEANEGIESYELLLAVCREKGVELVVGYKQMRDLLERICRSEMQNESLQMTDLSARISFVGAKTGLTYAEQNRLHTFRLTSNRVLNHQLVPTRENLLRDVKTLAFLIRKLIYYRTTVKFVRSIAFTVNAASMPSIVQRSFFPPVKRFVQPLKKN